MKKYSNILVALGVTLFLLTVGMKSEAEAQCKQGFTYKKDTMMIAGCPWVVEICFKCGLSYPGEVELIGLHPIPQSPPCVVVPLQQAAAYAYGQLANPSYIYNILCPHLPAIPPCPFQSQKLIISYQLCWKMKKIFYFGEEIYQFLPCGTGSCKEEITFCYNAGTLTFEKVSNLFLEVPPDCSLEEDEIDLPVNVGDESNCFLYHSPCNP